MRKTAIFILTAVAIAAQAQKVTFTSEGIEAGVRHHLGLDANADIPQSRTDTITAIDLSGLSITDLRDIVYLPNVRALDLSDNNITNVGPLNVLDSLRELNLKKNALESINLLAFSNSDKMIVDVTANYIEDFSYFFDCIKCQFTLIGMNRQQAKDIPYLDVYQLYADVKEDGQTVIWYRGFTNMKETPILVCGDTQANATINGHLNSIAIPGSPINTTAVVLSCGGQSDNTYIVPSLYFTVKENETITIETGLPDDYVISSAFAERGTATIDGTKVNYTASNIVTDVLYVSYSDGIRFRGFTKYNLVGGDAHGDVNNDGMKNIVDVTLLVRKILGSQGNVQLENTDVDGDGDVDYDDVKTLINSILLKNQ